MTWATGIVSVLTAVTVSPLLAAWTVGLSTDTESDVPWWHPGRISAQRFVVVAASEALGNTTEADAYVKRIMANHDADVEEDLPPRTAAILRRRRWLPPAA